MEYLKADINCLYNSLKILVVRNLNLIIKRGQFNLYLIETEVNELFFLIIILLDMISKDESYFEIQ